LAAQTEEMQKQREEQARALSLETKRNEEEVSGCIVVRNHFNHLSFQRVKAVSEVEDLRRLMQQEVGEYLP
jgi:hypothetical protein